MQQYSYSESFEEVLNSYDLDPALTKELIEFSQKADLLITKENITVKTDLFYLMALRIIAGTTKESELQTFFNAIEIGFSILVTHGNKLLGIRRTFEHIGTQFPTFCEKFIEKLDPNSEDYEKDVSNFQIGYGILQ